MKIATWNVNSINVRLPQLIDWLNRVDPDIVGLQELKCDATSFPLEALEALGYHIVVNAQKTYNGVALLSKVPATDIMCDIPKFVDDQKRVVAGTIQDIRVINVYVPNGQSPQSDKYVYKLEWLDAFYDYLQGELMQYEKLLVMGDFNIAPTDDDVHNPALWKDQVLCTQKERDAFKRLLSLGFVDVLRLYAAPKGIFTWWDYRQQGFEKNEGVRIDHVLLSKELSARYIESSVYIEVRANERPSDHAPVGILLKI